MAELTQEAKDEIKAAMQIIREDRFAAFVRTTLGKHATPPEPTPTPDAPPPGPTPPPPDPNTPPPTPKKSGLWWPANDDD